RDGGRGPARARGRRGRLPPPRDRGGGAGAHAPRREAGAGRAARGLRGGCVTGERRVYRDAVLYRRLLAEARPFWPHISVIFLLQLLAAPLALLAPLPLKIVVDNVLGDHPLPSWVPLGDGDDAALVFAVGLLVSVALFTQVQQVGASVLGTFTGERLQLRFRARLSGHAQRLSLAYHDTHGTADSTYRILYDAPAIQWISVYGITPFLSALLTLGSMLYVTARIDARLAAVAMVTAPVLF